MIKYFVNKLLPKKSNLRLLFSWIIKNHLYGVRAVVRSIYCTKKLTGQFFPIQCLVYPKMELHLKIDKTADVQLKGKLHVNICWSGSGASYIEVSKGSQFVIKNDFHIGQNIQIVISANGHLIFGGGNVSRPSGITSDTKILVAEKIDIGKSTIVSWGCVITDSDWHNIDGLLKTKPVYIGDHVWLSHDVSVLKGAMISDNTIVGAKSMVTTSYSQHGLLLAGSPAKIIKEHVTWTH